jgi:hypothetical protein
VPDALALDRHPAALAVEHERHRDQGLERVPLRAPGRADISLAARDPDREVEDGVDHVGGDARAVVDDHDPAVVDLHLEPGRRVGLLGSIDRVVDELLHRHARPLLELVANLRGELALGGEVEQAAGAEGLALLEDAHRLPPITPFMTKP